MDLNSFYLNVKLVEKQKNMDKSRILESFAYMFAWLRQKLVDNSRFHSERSEDSMTSKIFGINQVS